MLNRNLRNFHVFLSGRAKQWYWVHIRQFRVGPVTQGAVGKLPESPDGARTGARSASTRTIAGEKADD